MSNRVNFSFYKTFTLTLNTVTNYTTTSELRSYTTKKHKELTKEGIRHLSCTAKKVLPCVYALLPNKQQVAYTRLFDITKQHHHSLAPRNVMVDFEIAALNAIDTSFPDANKKECVFHLSQAIFLKIQSLGL